MGMCYMQATGIYSRGGAAGWKERERQQDTKTRDKSKHRPFVVPGTFVSPFVLPLLLAVLIAQGDWVGGRGRVRQDKTRQDKKRFGRLTRRDKTRQDETI
jgi:hypothetical protein